jgi:diguanylate cyclase (GGDEF)-like protein/PAS domain S-box-containing protein
VRPRIQRRELADFELGLWRLFFEIRILSLGALGVISLLPFTDVDLMVVLFVLGLAVPSNIAMRELLPRLRLVPWWMPFGDAVMGATAIAIQPELAPIVLIVMLGSSSQAATAGWRPTILATLLGAPLLFAASARYDLAEGMTQIVAYLSVSLGITVFVAVIANAEREGRESREELLDGIDAIVWEAHPYPFVNATVTGNTHDVLGLDPEELSGQGAWLSRLPAFDRTEVVRQSQNAIDEGRDHELTYRVADADGALRHVRDRVRVVVDADGIPVTARGVVVDVTDEVQVRESNRNLAELVERVPVGLVVARADKLGEFTTISVNPAFELLVGRPAKALLNTPLTTALDGPGADDVLALLADARRTGQTCRRAEAGDVHLGGDRILSLEAFPISDELFGLNVVDETDRVITSRTLRHQALHDELTGLPNRALIEDRLRHGIAAARRDDNPVALLLLDLNQFKEVNDTLGHDQGDRLLKLVAARLRGALRAVDTVARLGGDEFAVLLTDDVSPRRTLRAAERVLACFDEPHDIDGMSLHCGASLGVAIYPEHGDDAETLRKHADIAMYAAKRRGGGVAVYDAERDESTVDRLTLVGQLRHALDNGELEIHYHPVVELSSARVVRIEALVRWNHPERGSLGPGDFIDVAEVSGVIRPLTRWVFEQAAIDVQRLEASGHLLDLAVNVSVRNLYEPAFVEAIQGALERTGLDGARVTLELTETQVMDDPLLAHGVLGRLSALGVRGSIDDFGTGHSSLSNLQSLPVSEIKIDKSFVLAMGDGDEAAATIVKSIVSLGQNLGLDVVAEGVETPSAMTRLAMLGCDYAQGYLFARPMARDELLDYLNGARNGVSF